MDFWRMTMPGYHRKRMAVSHWWCYSLEKNVVAEIQVVPGSAVVLFRFSTTPWSMLLDHYFSQQLVAYRIWNSWFEIHGQPSWANIRPFISCYQVGSHGCYMFLFVDCFQCYHSYVCTCCCHVDWDWLRVFDLAVCPRRTRSQVPICHAWHRRCQPLGPEQLGPAWSRGKIMCTRWVGWKYLWASIIIG